MINQLLLKGFEVELFTGTPSGEHVGVSANVARDLSDFVKEPDLRNLEFITQPLSDYSLLTEALIAPRRKLRKWLAPRKLTLLPGSTLSLGNSNCFERSDLDNPYHDFIEKTYGTRVVTASVHINLGINDLKSLFSALRLVRCEAALFLALSASSPFLDGVRTANHSQRWSQFPLTPENVPLFLSYGHYVEWIEEQLENRTMHNERHLWTSVRPNGPRRPYELNRLELRICDLISDPATLLAVTALLELRVLGILKYPEKLDPLFVSSLTPKELATLSDQNDAAVAIKSFDARLNHWRDGTALTCRNWLEQIIDEVTPIAIEFDLQQHLVPLHGLLEKGNQAMYWIKDLSNGKTLQEVIQAGIRKMVAEELPIKQEEVLL